MFNLTDADLARSIINYPNGISSFNTQMHQLGHTVISGDPNYHLSLDDMREHAEQTYRQSVDYLKQHSAQLQHNDQQTIDRILASFAHHHEQFLQDYEQGRRQQRYQAMQLPNLDFNDRQFDLALACHLFFHHGQHRDSSLIESIHALCRVALEVRIFPLLNQHGEISDELGSVLFDLQQHNYGIEIKQVAYETIKGGNAMLRIQIKQCAV